MKLLKDKIINEGKVKEGNILKVDNFLNHKLDIKLLNEIGKEFKKRFKNKKITKILTIESSGIAIATTTALQFDNIDVIFAKKTPSINIDGDVYSTTVHSFTKNIDTTIIVKKDFISKDDHILIIDDFLANASALEGLISICDQANATIEGIGIVIEKGMQNGGKLIRATGLQLESLAIIKNMDEKSNSIEFEE